ncbi:MAG: DUF4398 domain-containing protein [Steroidobacteraceae bacterium]
MVLGHTITLMAVSATAVLIAGCASRGPIATAERAEARTLIQQAEASGAAESAADALGSARANYQKAETAAQNGDEQQGRQAAQKAVVDARLALVRTEQVKAQHAAAELRESIDTLRSETKRNGTR